MKIYDVTISLSADIPLYPGDPEIVVEPKLRLSNGDSQNLTYYGFSSHTGTHIDAPSHFIAGGKTVDQLPIELLIGRTRVIQFASGNKITAESLEEHDLSEVVRVLFKTRNSYLWQSGKGFVKNYVHLTVDAAEHLIESGIKVVGIDYLSVDKYPSEKLDVHLKLLQNGIIIIEGLDLREVDPGDYEMICLPMKIKDGDGAPARVILRALSVERRA
jgi:arylformamidase